MTIRLGPLTPLEQIDLLEWSTNRRDIRGEPFTVIPPLQYLYRDQSPEVYIEKAAQLFISEYLINLALFAADTKWAGRGVVLYYFPSGTQITDFSATRIDPVIFYSPYLAIRQRAVKDKNKRASIKQNVQLKGVAEGFIYLRGAQNRRQMISVDADVVIFDEIDMMIDETVEAGKRRTDSSSHPFIRGASTPVLPDKGVDRLIRKSTNKAWIVKCYSCGNEQDLSKVHGFVHKLSKSTNSRLLTIPDVHPVHGNLFHRSDKYYIGCPHCHRLINVWNGLWVNQARLSDPYIDHEGYHLPKLFSNRVSHELLNEIGDKVEKEQAGQLPEAKIQEFYNSILGLPRAPQGTQLDLSQLESAGLPDPARFYLKDYKTSYFSDFLNSRPRRCFMGADVGGRRLHVNIIAFPADNEWLRAILPSRNDPVLVFSGNLDDNKWRELDRLMVQYDVARCVVDSQPEYGPAAEFAKRWYGRAFTSHYPSIWQKRGSAIYEFYDHKEGHEQEVAIGRSECMDMVFDYIISHTLKLPANVRVIGGNIDEQGIGDFCRHIMALTKVINDKGRAEYITTNGEDHLAHALLYAFVAARLSALDSYSNYNPVDLLSAMAMFDVAEPDNTAIFPQMIGSFDMSRRPRPSGGRRHSFFSGRENEGFIRTS